MDLLEIGELDVPDHLVTRARKVLLVLMVNLENLVLRVNKVK